MIRTRFEWVFIAVFSFVPMLIFGQTIYGPYQQSWENLKNAQLSSAFEIGEIEIKDGNSLEGKGMAHLKNEIPKDAKIIRTPSLIQLQDPVLLNNASPQPVRSYLGLDDGNVRGISTIPPDTHGAVGEQYVLSVTNSEIVVKNKLDGTIANGIIRLNNFFSTVTFGNGPPSCFDPRAIYDYEFQRFIVITAVNAREVNNSGYIIAISQPGNPLGNWTFYGINSDPGGTTWFDFPYIGFNKNFLVVTANMFTANNTFNNSKIWAFDKLSLYSGQPLDYSKNIQEFFQPANSGTSYAPATDYDHQINEIFLLQNFLGNSNGSGYLRLSKIEGTIPSAQLSFIGLVENTGVTWASSGGGGTGFAPQLGSDRTIDVGDARMGNAILVNGSLWCTHTIFQPATNPTLSSVSWYNLDLEGFILQHGILGGSVYRYYPSIAVNRNNDVLIGYTVSNLSTYASAAYAYRTSSDPFGQFRNEYVFQEGKSFYFKTFSGTRNRWGDYSNTVVDPVDQSLWTVQQYAEEPTGGITSRWATQWAQVAASRVSPPLPVQLIDFQTEVIRSQKVNTTWEVALESKLSHYEIQRSKDGGLFETIGKVIPRNENATQSTSYSFIDQTPLFGNSFYRLKAIDRDGSAQVSPNRKVFIEKNNSEILGLAPNPVKNDLNIRFYSHKTQKINLSIVNAVGQVLAQKAMQVSEGYYIEVFNLSNAASGKYFLVCTDDSGRIKNLPFVKL
jgi:hypothetical protein